MTLRDRWVDILSFEQNSDSVRLEDKNEEQYYFEAEILTDKLLGLGECENRRSSLVKDTPLVSMRKSIGTASSVLLVCIPVAAFLGSVLFSGTMRNVLSSFHSSVTPYLVPSFSVMSASIRNLRYQMQAIATSLPYFLRNLNHIKPIPFLYKLLRKCIMVEAWRHIWMVVYKSTQYLWRGTLRQAKSAYERFCPAWIRRGVKSMFQSMVQAVVHAKIGGIFGSVLSSVTFESWVWSTGDSGDSHDISDAVTEHVISESMDSDAAQSLMANGMDALNENVVSAAENACEAISENAVDALLEGEIESSLEDVVGSLVDSDSE